MKLSTLFRSWWVILIQGILMILLSVIIFNNPVAVVTTMAFWLGITVLITGLVGVIAYFTNNKADRDAYSLFGGLIILIIGVLMLSKMFITVKAITIIFGLLVTIIGLMLISGSLNGRKLWSLWWLIALLGLGALITGIKSILDINEGAETVSTIVGVSVLISGIGLLFLAFLKKRIADRVK
jgi:uncharacterized membrane protein HdeD (DUF308 family)